MKIKNKAQMGLVVSIAIIILSGLIILGLWKIMFSKADEASAEALCYGSNAVRMWGKQEAGNLPLFDIAPRTCRRIEKIIPGDNYPPNKEGTMHEIRDMTAKCWWMWLEGAEKNMFRDILGKDPCFICYSFNIKKGIETFTGAELAQSMRDNAYIVKDSSDNCAAIGGGFCGKDTSNVPISPVKEVKDVSKKCEEGEKCFISARKRDECVNKGGSCKKLDGRACADVDPREFPIEYNDWRCAVSGESCCVKKENYYDYFSYIQRYSGVGSGAIAYAPDDEFKAQEETYAITFISPNLDCSWACKLTSGVSILGGIGLAVGGTAATISLCSTILGCAIPIVIAIGGGAAIGAGGTGYALAELTDLGDSNLILLSPLGYVQNTCFIEAGITGE